MLDFLRFSELSPKKGVIDIVPDFSVIQSKDLMIRGRKFYAIWVEENQQWSMNEFDAITLIDKEMQSYVNSLGDKYADQIVRVKYLRSSSTGSVDKWKKYCERQMPDNYKQLDETIIFSNTEMKRENYSSKRLSYPLEEGSYAAWDRLIGTLYSKEERHKIEWAIGAIVNGASKDLQKFMVFYGSAGTGKSTIMNIIQMMFDGYCSSFDSKALGSASSAFSLEPFRYNPLVAIQHDGDLSRIEDNTRLNSLVSHEVMSVNVKNTSAFDSKFNSFLIMGTNKPVRITDARSGLLRRLIDVSPTGQKIPTLEYRQLMAQVEFELGAIAYHCKDVFETDPFFYDDYVPVSMMDATNDFYNFVSDSYYIFSKENSTTLKASWEMYKKYCEDANVRFVMPQRAFKEELKNYFKNFQERAYLKDSDTQIRNYYSDFDMSRFEGSEKSPVEEIPKTTWLDFGEKPSMFDAVAQNYPAQYANKNGTPNKKWANVTTTLRDLDSSELHYIKVPLEHIVIDFDLTDEDGNKSFEKNLEAAEKWPKTYAELSKSGAGIHLHYIYTGGDPDKLSRVYSPNVEVKVFTGDSSLRRKLTKCNDLPIAKISSGLPLKGDKVMVNMANVKSEKELKRRIYKGIHKEYSPYTKPSIDFIKKDLDSAYAAGFTYDVRDLKPLVINLAAGSTHNASYCMKTVAKMKFQSKDVEENEIISANPKNLEDKPIVFYDVEVFPNLFLVNWKKQGEGHPIVRLINPSPKDIEELLNYRLIGFNNRRYDNHMIYGCLIGETAPVLYSRSQAIISKKDKNAFFRQAYNLSYTDIYDYSSKKQSLKKWEIELGIKHQELGLPWDQPVPEEKWPLVSEYCDNDVLATEKVFEATQADFQGRLILAELTGMTPNDTTNSLSARLIFGGDKHPQKQFNYRNLGDVEAISENYAKQHFNKLYSRIKDKEYFCFDENGKPIFKSYNYTKGVSLYRGEEVGEGGYVYAEPGMYSNVALLDIASMHPSSAIVENLFGDLYTQRFSDLKEARIAIKHEDWENAEKMMDGKLKPYIEKCKSGEIRSSDLAYALKIVINSVYGLTSAKFDNPFRDPRNIDNIVAKRGALFMVNLKHEVQKQGFTVAHIKTDSIKIPNATPEIIQFVMDYGRACGYDFEHEATYEKMCLVNDAVYVAKYADSGKWTATGTQFQVPYVFKTLFSREPIEFKDLCETKSVTTALYLDMNEGLPDVSEYEKERKAAVSKLRKAEKNYGDYLNNMRSLEDGIKKLQEADDVIDVSDDIKANRERIEEFNKLSQDAMVSIKSLPIRIEELRFLIEPGHNYKFVGRVGAFSPVKEGGGLLVREQKGEFYAATGSKGYRWVESETLNGDMSKIDMDYYNNLVNDAIAAISQYGDVECFRS